MNPFLLFGGSSKQRRDYAVKVAKQNNWFLWEVNRQNFQSELRKTSITSSLTGEPNIVFLTNVERLSEKLFTKLLKIAEESPHRFILSTSAFYKIPKPIRQQLHLIRIGDVPPAKLFSALTTLMSEPNRELVRQTLSDPQVNVEQILYILKNNVWKAQNPEIFHAVESCFKCLHKVNKEYIVSMLAYLFPIARLPLSFSRKDRKGYKDEEAILEKLRRKYRLPKFGALETFRILKQILPRQPDLASRVAQELKLSEKERKVLGIKHRLALGKQIKPKPVPSSSSLKKWV